MEVFRSDSKNNSLSVICGKLRLVYGDLCVTEAEIISAGRLLYLRVYEVHPRRAYESGYEEVARIIIELLRRIELLHDTVLHYADAVAHRHGLCLIVCYVDEGRSESLVKLADLRSHLSPELGVKV